LAEAEALQEIQHGALDVDLIVSEALGLGRALFGVEDLKAPVSLRREVFRLCLSRVELEFRPRPERARKFKEARVLLTPGASAPWQ
tara:strand:- start:264 stop:521 length:258 start_codon:yes stop_codon:yes gene_type:complete